MHELRHSLDEASTQRRLTDDEFKAFIYASVYLSAPTYSSSLADAEITLLQIAERRLEIARSQENGSAAISSAEWLAMLHEQSNPGLARKILATTLTEFSESLVAKPMPIARLFEIDKALGNTARMQEQADRALRVLQDPALKDPNGTIRATLHGIQVAMAAKLGNTDNSTAIHLQEEARFAEQSGNRVCLAASALHRATYLLSVNRMQSVNRFVSRALREDPEWMQIPGVRLELIRKRGLARSELHLLNPELAGPGAEDLRLALDDQTGFISRAQRANTLGALAVLHERVGQHDQAQACYSELKTQIQSLREQEVSIPPRVLCAEGIMESLTSSAPVKEIRDFLEAHVAELFKHREEIKPQPGGLGFLSDGLRKGLISELLTRCLQAEPGHAGLKRAFGWLVKSQALGSMARVEGYEYRGLKTMRQALTSDNRGILVYLPSPKLTHVFGLDATHLWHEQLPRAWLLERHRRAFLNNGLYLDPPGENYSFLSNELATDLIPPKVLDRMTEWDEVRIGGRSLVGYVPFELLPTTGGEAFGERFRVAYIPSLPVAEILEQRPLPTEASATPPVALFIAPTTPAALQEDFAPIRIPGDLDFTRLGSQRPREVRMWQGQDATFENLQTAAASGATILHLFMHGDLIQTRARPAGLLFASTTTNNGRVSCSDIENLPTVPPIVILSVCNAARGHERKGEDGLTDLGGAFLLAGAQVVILSPDDLEVEATYELAVRLQARLLQNETPVSALTGAIRATARDTRFKDPKYATMHATGLGFRLYH